MSEYTAIILHNSWQGLSGRTWEETCEKFPPQAEWFRKIANQLPKPVGWDRLYKLNMFSFFREIPTVDEIIKVNNSKELALWIRELLFTIYHTTRRDVRIEGLTELNYEQASMLMERDHRLRMSEPFRNRWLEIKNLRKEQMKSTQEIVEDVTNIIDFKEVQAKMAGKQPPDGNWIKDFSAGTRFLAYMKANSASILWDFILGTDPKELPAIYLGYENGPQGFGWRWHDPVKFCKEFGLYSILEVSDGNSNNVSEGTVEGDGKPEIIPPVHEGE